MRKFIFPSCTSGQVSFASLASLNDFSESQFHLKESSINKNKAQTGSNLSGRLGGREFNGQMPRKISKRVVRVHVEHFIRR